jgi:hypothetical protein
MRNRDSSKDGQTVRGSDRHPWLVSDQRESGDRSAQPSALSPALPLAVLVPMLLGTPVLHKWHGGWGLGTVLDGRGALQGGRRDGRML